MGRRPLSLSIHPSDRMGCSSRPLHMSGAQGSMTDLGFAAGCAGGSRDGSLDGRGADCRISTNRAGRLVVACKRVAALWSRPPDSTQRRVAVCCDGRSPCSPHRPGAGEDGLDGLAELCSCYRQATLDRPRKPRPFFQNHGPGVCRASLLSGTVLTKPVRTRRQASRLSSFATRRMGHAHSGVYAGLCGAQDVCRPGFSVAYAR